MPRPKGSKLSDETKRKISDSSKGRVVSQETRSRIGKANSGKTRSEDLRKQISVSLTGRKQTPEHIANRARSRIGYHHSDASKKKISDAHIGMKRSEESKKEQSERNKRLGIKPPSRKGVKLLPHQIEALRKANTGRSPSPEHIEILRECNKNRVVSDETRQRMRDASHHIKGEDHWNWNPDREQFNLAKKIKKKARTAIDNTLRLLKGKKGDWATTDLLGYSFADLVAHLQSFPNWLELQSQIWHLDHIFPIKAFIDFGINDTKLINSLDNLQPLTKKENLSKSDNYDRMKFETWLKSKGVI